MFTDPFDEALWVAHTLFQLGRATGSTANISFRLSDGNVAISCSGSCFGTLERGQFSVVSPSGTLISGGKPSKEYPLHAMFYRRFADVQAVVHTHSLYATLWSCLQSEGNQAPWKTYTPYLQMKLGRVDRIPYAPPGSQALFTLAEQSMTDSRGYVLDHHGPIVAGKSIMDAFYAIEELEESAKVAWLLRGEKANTL